MSVYLQLSALQTDQGIAGKLAGRMINIIHDIKSGKVDRIKGQDKMLRLFTSYLHEEYENKSLLQTIIGVITDRKNDLSSI